MKPVVRLECGGVCCETAHEYDLPDGWSSVSGADCEQPGSVFCPSCKGEQAFFDSQCPGCFYEPGDCPLWKAFAFSDSPGLEPRERDAVACGICPFLINGTFEFRAGVMLAMDLSTPAAAASGKLVVAGIDRYIETYRSERG